MEIWVVPCELPASRGQVNSPTDYLNTKMTLAAFITLKYCHKLF